MSNHYLLTAGSGSAELEVKKSRFISHVGRATTEDEAREFIARISREHWNASHNCYAWSLGEHPRLQRSGDDGEPSGTAGIPMLEVLKQRDLTDTVLVVIRSVLRRRQARRWRTDPSLLTRRLIGHR